MELIEKLKWRYATKKLDPSKPVSAEKVERIVEAVRLAPTSSGLQPFELLVVTNPQVREKIRASFGPFPEKTPHNPRVTGVVKRDQYTIEKVIFESRPEFPVTANLYVPTGRKFPLPGVVGSCGHSNNGKAN